MSDLFAKKKQFFSYFCHLRLYIFIYSSFVPMKMSHLENSTTVINLDIFITGDIRRGTGGRWGEIENDSLKFQLAGGLKTRDRCERMRQRSRLSLSGC